MPRNKETDPYLALPLRIRRIIDVCRAGEKLCLDLRPRRFDGEADGYFFEPSGVVPPAISARQATETPFLVASGDGLLPDSSQTWTSA